LLYHFGTIEEFSPIFASSYYSIIDDLEKILDEKIEESVARETTDCFTLNQNLYHEIIKMRAIPIKKSLEAVAYPDKHGSKIISLTAVSSIMDTFGQDGCEISNEKLSK
jgi:hypothetical protein